MKKTITILSIISLIISISAFIIAVAMLTIFWKPISSICGLSTDMAKTDPTLPMGSTLYIAGCLTVAIALIITFKLKKILRLKLS